MLERLAETLLWDKHLSHRWKAAIGAAILLAPLALAGAVFLQWRIQQTAPLRIEVDRGKAISSARAFLESRGVDVMGWSDSLSASTDMTRYRYLVGHGEAGAAVIRSLGGWGDIKVGFSERETGQNITLTISPGGDILSFTVPSATDIRTADQAAVAVLGEKAIAEFLNRYPILQKKKCETSTREEMDLTSTIIRCDMSVTNLPDLTGNLSLTFHGTDLGAKQFRLVLSDEMVKTSKTSKPLQIAFWIYTPILCIFMIGRYWKRRLQKEVSRQRMVLVATIIASFLIGLYLLQDVSLKISTSQELLIPFWVALGVVAISSFAAGQLPGLAYAAAEGDLREKRPGLLTSLDALLSGHMFSRNVGRSVLLGTVILAYTLLLRDLIELNVHDSMAGVSPAQSAMNYALSRAPWLMIILTAVGSAVCQTLISVLCPIAILERRLKSQKLILLLLILCCALVTAHLNGVHPTSASKAAQWFLFTFSMVFSFLGVDLLASVASLTGMFFVADFIAYSQAVTVWKWSDDLALLVGGGFVLVQSVCAFHGKVVDEVSVRPSYAKEIQERLQLESEVEAAKEAQQRLLPEGPPLLPGLSLAASVQATEKVSGDFYDFYPISATKVGIFISDGGGNGLATALTIALAKGFLMYKTQEPLTPTETLQALLHTLGKELEGINAEGICYMTVDVQENTLRFARYGETPAIMVAGGEDHVQEMRVQESGLTLWEGFAKIGPNSRVIAYTNGLSRLIGEPDRGSTNRWLMRRIGGNLWQSAEDLHDSIVKTIFTTRTRIGKRRVTDDVTVIVCGVDRSAAPSLTQVA